MFILYSANTNIIVKKKNRKQYTTIFIGFSYIKNILVLLIKIVAI